MMSLSQSSMVHHCPLVAVIHPNHCFTYVWRAETHHQFLSHVFKVSSLNLCTHFIPVYVTSPVLFTSLSGMRQDAVVYLGAIYDVCLVCFKQRCLCCRSLMRLEFVFHCRRNWAFPEEAVCEYPSFYFIKHFLNQGKTTLSWVQHIIATFSHKRSINNSLIR